MIILDTNVISEPNRPSPSLAVLSWLDNQSKTTLFLAAISLGEILSGLAMMPVGKRRADITVKMRFVIGSYFGTRILSFDERAAEAYAEILSAAHSKGRAVSQADAQIAAIAKVNGFAVATRDAEPFHAADVEVIHPWEDET